MPGRRGATMMNDTLDQYPRRLGRSITYLHRQKVKFMNNRLKEYEIYGAMYMILNHVDRHPGTTQDAIVLNLSINKCTIARRTKKLEELGFLYRETDPTDRRQNNLFLTEKGAQVVPVIRRNLRAWSELISRDLSDGEKETLVSLLERLVDASGRVE